MNDDRNFKKREETVKLLLLEKIPKDLITQIVGISDSTLCNDVKRLKKRYGIVVPRSSKSIKERKQLFHKLLKKYLEVEVETKDYDDTLYKAAKLYINVEAIDCIFYSVSTIYDELKKPLILATTNKEIACKSLLEDIIGKKETLSKIKFYSYLYDGTIDIDNVYTIDDLRKVVISYYLSQDRKEINPIVVENPEEIVKELIKNFSDRERVIVVEYYGLEGTKSELSELASRFYLRRDRIRQIFNKIYGILREKLMNRGYLVNIHEKVEKLERDNQMLVKDFECYKIESMNKINVLQGSSVDMNDVMKAVNLYMEDNNADIGMGSLLSLSLYDLNFSMRIYNVLKCYDIEYLVDIVENWKNIPTLRGLGRHSFREIEDMFESLCIVPECVSDFDIMVSKEIIKRKENC